MRCSISKIAVDESGKKFRQPMPLLAGKDGSLCESVCGNFVVACHGYWHIGYFLFLKKHLHPLLRGCSGNAIYLKIAASWGRGGGGVNTLCHLAHFVSVMTAKSLLVPTQAYNY